MPHLRILRIGFVSLTVFFFAVLAVALQPDDNTFFRRSRSISKVNTSLPGTISKSKTDSAPAAMVASIDLESVLALLTTASHENTTLFISSQVVYLWPNKAPPLNA